MKRIVFILFCISIVFATFSQQAKKNYLLHVGDQPRTIEGSLESNWENIRHNPEYFFEGELIVLIQFNSIPTENEKNNYLTSGIELLSYIPNFSWIAKIQPSVSLSDLVSFNVRNISSVDHQWKLPSVLINRSIPSHAGTADNVSVNVMFFDAPKQITCETLLSDYNVKVGDKNETFKRVSIVASVNELIELSKHPLVQYIEFIEPPIQNEGILDESERIISTYISNNPGKNYFFTGAGANIAVDEGGILNPIENPNFRSRIVRTFENSNTPSGHKTNVGIRMAKAGNLDPTEQGTAFGATLYSGGLNTQTAASNGIHIVNRSYGWGCPSGLQTYNSSSLNYDFYVRTNPAFIITHSAGNAGGSTCYAGSPGWGNITGMPKMAKNIFNVGSSGNDGNLTGFSSRGPAKDGRILPHIVSPGQGGTSYASPNLAGVFAQLHEAYRFHNSNTVPDAGLLKAVIMNTADDMLNPGPDFKTGFGHVNARRAYEVIKDGNFTSSSVSQGTNNAHSIVVPANVVELKVMVYWVDYEATPGITTRSLVNDLDITLTDPNNTVYQPWVLNPTFDPIALNQPATRATDSLNNNEQITIDNPVAGTYQLNVQGSMIPQGPQEYYMTYEFVLDDIIVTHPHGGEKFVPGETERIRWDAVDGSQNFALSYSNDDGATWNSIATGVGANDRYYDWIVPQDLTADALIKVERGSLSGESDANFSIAEPPLNLELIWSCSFSSMFSWDETPNADGYIFYRIEGDYMDSIFYTTNTSAVINGFSLSQTEYVAIAVVKNGVTSRRTVAIERNPGNLNCNNNDLGALDILSPGADNLPSCMSNGLNIKIRIKNQGVNTVTDVPVGYRINGGNAVLDTANVTINSGEEYDFTFSTLANLNTGNNSIEVWTELNGDPISQNDSLLKNVSVFSGLNIGPNFTQNFDNFSNCSTAWDCELVTCPLQNGWVNITNGSGDDIDWRTHSGSTGSGGTGPSSDHTSGFGKYVYLEGSGPCNNSTAKMYSPCFNLNGISVAQLTFWYHAFGSSIGELHVDVLADGELYEDVMTPVIGEQGNQWIEQTVDLSQFSNQLVVLIFRGSNGSSGWLSDLALDDIQLQTSPIAQYAVSQEELCLNQTTTLLNASSYGTSYNWSFQPNTVTYEAGTNSNSSNPQVSFSAPGLYTVELVATNSIGNDTLTNIDYIYVWGDQNPLVVNALCIGDSVIAQTNNNGQPTSFYLNGNLESSGMQSSHYFPTAEDGDTLFAVFDVNNTCTLYSDTIILDLFDVETGVNQTGSQLNAVAIGAQYQWLDCLDNFATINGATSNSFAPPADGEYAVEVTENGCIDTSDCLVFSTVSMSSVEMQDILCYPNPTTGEITVQFGAYQSAAKIEVLSILGELIAEYHVADTDQFMLSIQGEPAVYMLRVTVNQEEKLFRVVKH